jgi:hypothetical protein
MEVAIDVDKHNNDRKLHGYGVRFLRHLYWEGVWNTRPMACKASHDPAL